MLQSPFPDPDSDDLASGFPILPPLSRRQTRRKEANPSTSTLLAAAEELAGHLKTSRPPGALRLLPRKWDFRTPSRIPLPPVVQLPNAPSPAPPDAVASPNPDSAMVDEAKPVVPVEKSPGPARNHIRFLFVLDVVLFLAVIALIAYTIARDLTPASTVTDSLYAGGGAVGVNTETPNAWLEVCS